MEEKKSFGSRLNELFAGKGFYIVLLLCAGLIAGSVWLMAGGSRTDVELTDNAVRPQSTQTDTLIAEPDGALAVMGPAPATPSPRTDLPGHGPLMEETQPEARTEPESAPAAAEEPAAQPEMESVDYFIWPVNGKLLRSCSLEALCYDPTMRDWRLHTGWDIAAPAGERVLATANGLVSAVYADPMRGNVVEVRHSNGLTSVYGNLAAEIPVAPGQRVAVGSVLGVVGDTALNESGMESHLHFELLSEGENVDPALWLPSQN